MQHYKNLTYTAEGKLKNLQLDLKQKESENNELRQEKILHNEQMAREKSEREKQVLRDNERLKTELEFKKQEILELQRNIKQERAHNAEVGSPRIVSPNHRRPVQSPIRQALSPSTPKRNFPNKNTFMANEASPKKKGRLKDESKFTCIEQNMAFLKLMCSLPL